MTAKMSDKNTREDINKVFNLFDDDQTGHITLRNLKRVAKELGETMTGEHYSYHLKKTHLVLLVPYVALEESFLFSNNTQKAPNCMLRAWHGTFFCSAVVSCDHVHRCLFRNANLDTANGCENMSLEDAELLEMIERADTDQDGEINPEEFYAIMTKKTFT